MPGFKIKEQEGYTLSTAEKETLEAITVLGDPGADRILFWDESANTWKFLTVGTGLNITATTLTSTGLSNPMTAIGDMIYGDTAGAVARLAGNTTTTKKFLTSVGDGTNSTAPAYSLDFSTDGTLSGNSDTIIPSQKAIKTYADALVAGLLDYRGGYDASGNTYPVAGGSGTAGAVLKGDMWIISVAGTLGGEAVQVGDSIIANIDTPAQTASNWNHLNSNISYVPEDVANKVTSFQSPPTNTAYASEKLVKDSLDAKLAITNKATSSDINSGTDNDKYITPDALAGSDYEKNPMTTAGDIIYGGTSGAPTRLEKGTAGQVLTMNTSATAPEWSDASGGSSLPKMIISTAFETAARFTDTVAGTGSITYGSSGLIIDTLANKGSSSNDFGLDGSGSTGINLGSPTFTTSIRIGVLGTDFESFFGMGIPTVSEVDGITYTYKHIGFKITRASSGNTNLYATQADGTTETSSSSLTTVAADDLIRLMAVKDGTNGVNYYWSKNGSAWSAATNLTTNLPDEVYKIRHAVTSKNVSSRTSIEVNGCSYQI